MENDQIIGVYIVSALGAITSLVAAVGTIIQSRRKYNLEEAADKRESKRLQQDIIEQVNADTVDLYRQLSKQYEALNNKDKKLLRIITAVIRRLIVMQRSVSIITLELQSKIDLHVEEAQTINCPYYDDVSKYTLAHVCELDALVSATLLEIDNALLNGNGKSKEEQTQV